MWIPARVLDFLNVSRESFQSLREDLAACRAERDAYKAELAAAKANIDWLKLRYNQLEFENKALIEKAYQIKLPVPELATRPTGNLDNITLAGFDDIGDKLAAVMGMELHDHRA